MVSPKSKEKSFIKEKLMLFWVDDPINCDGKNTDLQRENARRRDV